MNYATVLSPEIPLYQLGYLAEDLRRVTRRRRQTVTAPRIPLRELGYMGQEAGKLISAAAAPASAITTAATAAAAGSWAGPIGAGVGVLVGLIGGLLAGHALRAKQARNENSAANIGVSGFDSDLKAIQVALKSGQIDAAGALQAVEQTAMAGYWTVVTPQMQPGRNGCQGGSSCPPDTSAQGRQPCTGDIGAACCIGCYQLEPSISGPNGVLAAIQGQSGSSGGPHTADIHIVAGSSYGASTRGAYTLDFTPPAVSATSSLTSALTAGGSGSMLPLLLFGGLALLAFR